jgi:hypothetical protein
MTLRWSFWHCVIHLCYRHDAPLELLALCHSSLLPTWRSAGAFGTVSFIFVTDMALRWSFWHCVIHLCYRHGAPLELLALCHSSLLPTWRSAGAFGTVSFIFVTDMTLRWSFWHCVIHLCYRHGAPLELLALCHSSLLPTWRSAGAFGTVSFIFVTDMTLRWSFWHCVIHLCYRYDAPLELLALCHSSLLPT